VRIRKGKASSALVVPCVSNFGEGQLAEPFRRHLRAAKIDRPALHGSTHTHLKAKLRSYHDAASPGSRCAAST